MGRWCGLSFTSYLPDDITVLETLEAIKLRGGHRADRNCDCVGRTDPHVTVVSRPPTDQQTFGLG